MIPWQHRLLWLSVIALFVGLPISKAVSSIGLVLWGISSILLLIQNGIPKQLKRFKPLLGVGAFYIFYFTSSLYSNSIVSSLEQSLTQHSFITLPLCFVVSYDWIRPRLKRLLSLFVITCTIHCIITLILLFLPEQVAEDIANSSSLFMPYPEQVDRLKFGLYTPFIDRLHLAYLLGFSIPYLLYQGLHSKWSKSNIIQIIVLLTTFVLIGARGAQLALLGALCIGGLSYYIHKIKSLNLPKLQYQQRVIQSVTVLIIGLFLVPYISYRNIPAVKKRYDQMQWELKLIENGGYINEEYQYFTTLSRIRSWDNAISIIKDNPILGISIGDYNLALEQVNATHNDKVPSHNQNFFLYIWGATGILGILSFFIGLWYYFQSFRTSGSPLRHLVLAYLLFILFSSMLDAFLKFHIGRVGVVMILSSLFIESISSKSKDIAGR